MADGAYMDMGEGKKTIMVVDDEAETVQLVMAVLELANFKVMSFINPNEGLDALKSGILRPDLIVLDVMMPSINGIEFSRRVREDLKMHDLKIVYFTAAPELVTDRTQEHRILGVISKPFTNDNLVERVQQYVNR